MKKKILLGSVVLVVLAGAVAIGAFAYGFRVMTLPTGNMSNTIIPSEHVAVTKVFSEIKRGDIVIFKRASSPDSLHTSRVIGLPGETIEVRGRDVLINGQKLPEIRVKVDLSKDDPAANKLLQELSEEGTGEYKVYYDKQTWEDSATDEQGMKVAVTSPFKIPGGQYFLLGDSRNNSLDSRFWGTVSQDAILWKAYMIFSSPVDERVFTKLK